MMVNLCFLHHNIFRLIDKDELKYVNNLAGGKILKKSSDNLAR